MICREKVSCMGVNCEEVLMLSFLFFPPVSPWHVDQGISCWVARWQTANELCFIGFTLQHTFLFSSLCHFSFHLPQDLPESVFQFIKMCKRCQSLTLSEQIYIAFSWVTSLYVEQPMLELWWGMMMVASIFFFFFNLSFLFFFGLLMKWSMLALSNHTWQNCAMESKVFNKHPRPLIKALLEKNWEKVCLIIYMS